MSIGIAREIKLIHSFFSWFHFFLVTHVSWNLNCSFCWFGRKKGLWMVLYWGSRATLLVWLFCSGLRCTMAWCIVYLIRSMVVLGHKYLLWKCVLWGVCSVLCSQGDDLGSLDVPGLLVLEEFAPVYGCARADHCRGVDKKVAFSVSSVPFTTCITQLYTYNAALSLIISYDKMLPGSRFTTQGILQHKGKDNSLKPV